MTQVELKCVPRYRVSAEGHATGSPALCSAISCLLYTLAGWLANADGVTVTEQRLEEGSACIEWSGGTGSETAMEMMMIGFLQLMKTEPERISVEVTI